MQNKLIVLVVVIVVLIAGAIFVQRNNRKNAVKLQQESVMKKDSASMEAQDKMTKEESMSKENSTNSPEKDAMMKSSPGTYIDYSAQAMSDAQKMQSEGKKVVLFFHAPWCPYCKSADQDFKSSISNSTFPKDTILIKVDYDSQTELKKKYGVTTQHTFVQIDSGGNQITKWVSGETSDLATKTK